MFFVSLCGPEISFVGCVQPCFFRATLSNGRVRHSMQFEALEDRTRNTPFFDLRRQKLTLPTWLLRPLRRKDRSLK